VHIVGGSLAQVNGSSHPCSLMQGYGTHINSLDLHALFPKKFIVFSLWENFTWFWLVVILGSMLGSLSYPYVHNSVLDIYITCFI